MFVDTGNKTWEYDCYEMLEGQMLRLPLEEAEIVNPESAIKSTQHSHIIFGQWEIEQIQILQ